MYKERSRERRRRSSNNYCDAKQILKPYGFNNEFLFSTFPYNTEHMAKAKVYVYACVYASV